MSAPVETRGPRVGTDQVEARSRAEFWYETVSSSLGGRDIVHADPGAIHFEVTARKAGDLPLVHSRGSPFSARRHAGHIRGDARDDLAIGFSVRGRSFAEQDDRRIRIRPGTIIVSDFARPNSATHETDQEFIGFTVPRERLERVFGSSKRFTLLPIDEALGSRPIVAFLTSLYENSGRMAPEMAAEMAGVGVELVISGLARRLAQEPVLPQSTALLLHRAQAFVAANLADLSLSPAMIAGALGISLRHLQALFQRRETTPSDWIWSRRLERARDNLASPGCAAISVGEVAYGCGFADPAHFSRRFKAAFGDSPREWRHRALLGGGTDPAR